MGFGEKDKESSVEDTSKGKTKEVKNIQEKTKQELDNFKKTLNSDIKDNPYFSDPYYQKATNQIGNWPYGATPESAIKAYAEKLRSKDKGYIKEDDVWIIASWGNKIFEGLPLKTYNTFVDLYHKRINGKMTKEEIDFKENISQKIPPWWYGVFEKMRSFADNKKEYTKEKMKKLKLPIKVREDLFRKYLWLEQYFNSIVESRYKPSQSTEKTKYYDFNETLRKKVILDVKKNLGINISFNDLIAYVWDKNKDKAGWLGWTYENIIGGGIKPIPSNILWQLGHHKVWIWYDTQRKEKYISYYDIRDLDPDILKDNNMDLDKYNSPFEIYGRIYESDFNIVQK